MQEPEDDRLRRELRSLGDEDRQRAPSFASLWSAAYGRVLCDRTGVGARGAVRPPRVLLSRLLGLRGLAYVTALVIVAVAAVFTLRHGTPLPSDEEALVLAHRISDWHAPSDGWLSTRTASIPHGVPALSIDSIPLPTDTSDLSHGRPGQVEEIIR